MVFKFVTLLMTSPYPARTGVNVSRNGLNVRFRPRGWGIDSAMTDFNTDSSTQRADEFTEPSAGPEPTSDEERAAERSADEVDLDAVDEHYQEMNEKGANVRGEGEIS